MVDKRYRCVHWSGIICLSIHQLWSVNTQGITDIKIPVEESAHPYLICKVYIQHIEKWLKHLTVHKCMFPILKNGKI